MSHTCKLCNKQYASYQSWWNHNKRKHTDIQNKPTIKQSLTNHLTTTNQPFNNQLTTNTRPLDTISDSNEKKFECKYCKKEFNFYNNKWRHEKTCKKAGEIKETEDKKLELELIKEEKEKIKEERLLKTEEAKILKLQQKLQNSTKVDNVRLKKLNKMLLTRHNRIQNSTVNTNSNNNNTQNNIVNYNTTYQLIGFGKEQNIPERLTHQEKRAILGSRYGSLEKLIEIVHCGNYNQFKNIIVTNIKDNYMYKYDDKKGVFVLSTKAEVLKSLVDFRMGDLEVIYNDFLENNRIGEITKASLERFINDMNYVTDKFTDTNGTTYENFKQYKIHEVKMLLYNNQDKIASDICLLLTTEEAPMEEDMLP